jgi:hypothetical protein
MLARLPLLLPLLRSLLLTLTCLRRYIGLRSRLGSKLLGARQCLLLR